MANKVKFGLKNVYYSVISVDDDGVTTFGTPVAIPGAVNLSLSAAGDTQNFYADDMKYWTGTSNNGYEGDLEIALIPDSFKTSVLGFAQTAEGGILETGDEKVKNFALMYEINGDVEKRRFVDYCCTATRPSSEASTVEDAIAPQTDTLSLSTAPLVYLAAASGTSRRLSRYYEGESGSNYANWFSAVPVPTETTSA
jgi:phi13 family phage major tail protein